MELNRKTQFEIFYDRYCLMNNKQYSVYNINFQTNLDVNLLLKNPKYELMYVYSDVTPKAIEDKFVVLKNQSNILLCFDISLQSTFLKLIFDSYTVNKKDLELFIITLRKNNIT